MTHRSALSFDVATSDNGARIIVLRPTSGDRLDMFRHYSIALELPAGTSQGDAQKVADYLKRNISGVQEKDLSGDVAPPRRTLYHS
jgi:hypothetical protein